jgi:hypothetical protein
MRLLLALVLFALTLVGLSGCAGADRVESSGRAYNLWPGNGERPAAQNWSNPTAGW